MLGLAYASGSWNERAYLGVFAQLWLLPNDIALITFLDKVNV